MDRDGTKKGFDLELINKIRKSINIPLVISGGANNIKHIEDACNLNVNGIALGSSIHYENLNIKDIKRKLKIT